MPFFTQKSALMTRRCKLGFLFTYSIAQTNEHVRGVARLSLGAASAGLAVRHQPAYFGGRVVHDGPSIPSSDGLPSQKLNFLRMC